MKVDWEGILPIVGQVIVVEDDATLQSLMVSILTEIGAEFVAFTTADDALTYLLQTNQRCCLVIADHGVPGQIQGTELIEMVNAKWPVIPAILTSGYLLDPSIVPLGTIYLHKPWSLDSLIIAITTLLQPAHPIWRS